MFQRLDRLLDFALGLLLLFGVERFFSQSLQCAFDDGGDHSQITGQRWLLGDCRLLCFQKQLGRGHHPFAPQRRSLAPSVIKLRRLPRRPWLFGECVGHLLALAGVHARHRHKVSQGDLRGDFALLHLPLNGFRQGFHQCQPPRHPTRATVKAPGQLVNRIVQPLFHFRQQPALFERRFRFAHPHRTVQQQRLGFVHLPHHRIDRVPAQLPQRGDAFVPVDDQIALLLFDNNDRSLLANLSQRGDQTTLARRVADPEVLQAVVQLMKFQGRHRVRLGFQYEPVFH